MNWEEDEPDIAVDEHNEVIQPEVKVIDETDNLSEDFTFDFTIWIFKPIKCSIFKPLLLLKITLFLWFGVTAAILPFIAVYLKQKGMTMKELSLIYIIKPVINLLVAVTCGVVTDKLGRSKPVLGVNMILVVLFLICIRLVPSLGPTDCENLSVDLRCHRLQIDRLIAETSCGIKKDIFHVRSCHVNCPENVTQTCDVQKNLICAVINREDNFKNFSMSIHVNSSYESKKDCFYDVNSLTYDNATYSWCDVPYNMYCSISCTLQAQEKCSLQKTYRTRLYISLLVFAVMLTAVTSTTFSIMDVTAMSMVKEHNKDFGRQRVWSIMGNVVWSPLAGYLITITTRKGEPDNYDAAFYLSCILALACLVAIWKLKAPMNDPGKKMWKKSMTLLKKPDVIAFILILLVMGSIYCFNKYFLPVYLKEELNASSILIGLLSSFGSIYGLPFLHTSNWWVNKAGATNIFVLALIAASVNNLGYSLLTEPWWSIFLEVTQILTYHLLWVAVVVYSHSIAPEGLKATVVASAGGIHFGLVRIRSRISHTRLMVSVLPLSIGIVATIYCQIGFPVFSRSLVGTRLSSRNHRSATSIAGEGSGGLIGGLSMDSFGGPTAFRIFSVLCFSMAVLYSVYLYVSRLKVKKLYVVQDEGETKIDAANLEKSNDVLLKTS